MATGTSVTDQINKLEAARKLVLGDAAYYPQIVQGILPIIGANARLELRRWGAEFLAEAFAAPALATMHKQSLSLAVLDTLKAILEIPAEDTAVLKSVVQASASIYPLVFRHIIANANDASTWAKMTAIKSKILGMWDTAPAGVRICCIKFVQRVIQVQTPGSIADPRRPDQNEVSLALVPRNHALIPPPNLEAEASGLLDRLLGVFQDDARDIVIVDATLNCLGVLIRSRTSIANKIIYAILNFDPHKAATAPLTPKDRVIIRSLERTTRALLVNVNKQNPTGPMAARIQQYIDRLAQSRLEVFDESSRKRAAPSEPNDGLDQSKRAKLGAQVTEDAVQRVEIPPLPPGPVTVAQLFSLTTDQALTSFDVQQFPIELVVQLTLPVMYKLNQALLNQALEGVRSRVNARSQQPAAPTDGPVAMDEDDDDYEPDYQPAEDVEQIVNKMDSAPEPAQEPEVSLAAFKLPPPPPLSSQELSQINQGTISRVVGFMNMLEEPVAGSKPKTGINRLAASKFDRSAWITLITRLATRGSSALEDPDPDEDVKMDGSAESALDRGRQTLGSTVRENLYLHVFEDFRKNIDAAVAWLNEEWYNDRIQLKQNPRAVTHYKGLVLKVLDGLLPYIDSRDKMFTRFVSELPEVDEAVLEKVKTLAKDPERVALAVNTLHYLVLYRPPAREISIDALEDLWRNYDDARLSAAKLLAKYRPEVLERDKASTSAEDAPREGAASTAVSVQQASSSSPDAISASAAPPRVSNSAPPAPPNEAASAAGSSGALPSRQGSTQSPPADTASASAAGAGSGSAAPTQSSSAAATALPTPSKHLAPPSHTGSATAKSPSPSLSPSRSPPTSAPSPASAPAESRSPAPASVSASAKSPSSASVSASAKSPSPAPAPLSASPSASPSAASASASASAAASASPDGMIAAMAATT